MLSSIYKDMFLISLSSSTTFWLLYDHQSPPKIKLRSCATYQKLLNNCDENDIAILFKDLVQKDLHFLINGTHQSHHACYPTSENQTVSAKI